MIECFFENKKNASLRHVTVGVIVVNNKNKVLLVKRAPGIWNGNKYTIPGGFLDRDESTQEGALRELLEETGIKGKIKFIFRINDSPKRPKEDRQNVDFLYIVEPLSEKVVLSKETQEVKWFELDNLPKEEEFAFDHRDSIVRYFEYLRQPYALPIIS